MHDGVSETAFAGDDSLADLVGSVEKIEMQPEPGKATLGQFPINNSTGKKVFHFQFTKGWFQPAIRFAYGVLQKRRWRDQAGDSVRQVERKQGTQGCLMNSGSPTNTQTAISLSDSTRVRRGEYTVSREQLSRAGRGQNWLFCRPFWLVGPYTPPYTPAP